MLLFSFKNIDVTGLLLSAVSPASDPEGGADKGLANQLLLVGKS